MKMCSLHSIVICTVVDGAGVRLCAGALSDEDLCTLVAEECGYVKG